MAARYAFCLPQPAGRAASPSRAAGMSRRVKTRMSASTRNGKRVSAKAVLPRLVSATV
jgi:hypothetical protein